MISSILSRQVKEGNVQRKPSKTFSHQHQINQKQQIINQENQVQGVQIQQQIVNKYSQSSQQQQQNPIQVIQQQQVNFQQQQSAQQIQQSYQIQLKKALNNQVQNQDQQQQSQFLDEKKEGLGKNKALDALSRTIQYVNQKLNDIQKSAQQAFTRNTTQSNNQTVQQSNQQQQQNSQQQSLANQNQNKASQNLREFRQNYSYTSILQPTVQPSINQQKQQKVQQQQQVGVSGQNKKVVSCNSQQGIAQYPNCDGLNQKQDGFNNNNYNTINKVDQKQAEVKKHVRHRSELGVQNMKNKENLISNLTREIQKLDKQGSKNSFHQNISPNVQFSQQQNQIHPTAKPNKRTISQQFMKQEMKENLASNEQAVKNVTNQQQIQLKHYQKFLQTGKGEITKQGVDFKSLNKQLILNTLSSTNLESKNKTNLYFQDNNLPKTQTTRQQSRTYVSQNSYSSSENNNTNISLCSNQQEIYINNNNYQTLDVNIKQQSWEEKTKIENQSNNTNQIQQIKNIYQEQYQKILKEKQEKEKQEENKKNFIILNENSLNHQIKEKKKPAGHLRSQSSNQEIKREIIIPENNFYSLGNNNSQNQNSNQNSTQNKSQVNIALQIQVQKIKEKIEQTLSTRNLNSNRIQIKESQIQNNLKSNKENYDSNKSNSQQNLLIQQQFNQNSQQNLTSSNRFNVYQLQQQEELELLQKQQQQKLAEEKEKKEIQLKLQQQLQQQKLLEQQQQLEQQNFQQLLLEKQQQEEYKQQQNNEFFKINEKNYQYIQEEDENHLDDEQFYDFDLREVSPNESQTNNLNTFPDNNNKNDGEEVVDLDSLLECEETLECDESDLKKKQEKQNQLEIIEFENKIKSNPQTEIIQQMILTETKYQFNSNYLEKHPDVNWIMRSIMFDWMMEVSNEFMLKRESLYMAFNLVDRFLALTKKEIQKNQLQLLGVTCLQISSKQEEIYPPSMDDFVKSCDNGYSKEEIRMMEINVLQVLNFLINPITLNYWAQIYLQEWDSYNQNSHQENEQIPLILFKQPNEISYSYYREIMQVLDVVSIELDSLKFENRKILASSIYFCIGKNMGVFDNETVYTCFIQKIIFLEEEALQQFNFYFEKFVKTYFGFKLSELQDTMLFVASFYNLVFNFELPVAAKVNKENVLQGMFEEFLAFQTHNTNNLQCIKQRQQNKINQQNLDFQQQQQYNNQKEANSQDISQSNQ